MARHVPKTAPVETSCRAKDSKFTCMIVSGGESSEMRITGTIRSAGRAKAPFT